MCDTGDSVQLRVWVGLWMAKGPGARSMGASVDDDETSKKMTSVASTGESSGKVNNIPAGYAAAPAASADETALVKLLG